MDMSNCHTCIDGERALNGASQLSRIVAGVVLHRTTNLSVLNL